MHGDALKDLVLHPYPTLYAYPPSCSPVALLTSCPVGRPMLNMLVQNCVPDDYKTPTKGITWKQVRLWHCLGWL